MKYFIGINFLATLFLIWIKTFLDNISVLFIIIESVLYSLFLPAAFVLGIFGVKAFGGDLIAVPGLPTVIITFIFFVAIRHLIILLDKKISTNQIQWRSKHLYSFLAILFLFNIGLVFDVTPKILEKYKYRSQAFQQQLNQLYDFSDLNFSIKTPSDWVESKYSPANVNYLVLIPQLLEDKSEKSGLIVSPSVSLVDSFHISTTIYEVFSGYKTDLFCKGGGFQKIVFAGRSALECIIDNSYEYGKLIRITDLSGLGPNWKEDNLIYFYLLNEHTNLAPLYESVLSTLEFQSKPNNGGVNVNNQSLDNSSIQTTSQTSVSLASLNVINFSIKKGNIVEGSTKPEDFVMFTNDPFDATVLKSTHWKAAIVGNWINTATNGTADLAYRVGINYHAYELPVGQYIGSITYSGNLGSELAPQTVTVYLTVTD